MEKRAGPCLAQGDDEGDGGVDGDEPLRGELLGVLTPDAQREVGHERSGGDGDELLLQRLRAQRTHLWAEPSGIQMHLLSITSSPL